MPIEALLVDGKRYLYFYYYNSGRKRKERIYCGPALLSESQRRVEELEKRYVQYRRIKEDVNLELAELLRLEIAGDNKGVQKQKQAILAVLAEKLL